MLSGQSQRNSGNGKDDDHDGYVDDVHGWDFIGGDSGDIHYENLELTGLCAGMRALYDGEDSLAKGVKFRQVMLNFKRIWKDFSTQLEIAKEDTAEISKVGQFSAELSEKTGKIDRTVDD